MVFAAVVCGNRQVGLASLYPSMHVTAAGLVASECSKESDAFDMDEQALHLALSR